MIMKITSVRRELNTEVPQRPGGHDLRAAANQTILPFGSCGDIAQPKTLLTVLLFDIQDVLAIWRDGGQPGFAGIRNSVCRRILKRSGPGTGEESVDPVDGRRNQQNRNQAGDADT